MMQPSRMTQKRFRAVTGDDAVVFVRPARVDQHTGSKWPVAKARIKSMGQYLPKAVVNALRPALKKREPFVVPAAHFQMPTAMADTALFRKMSDFVHRSGAIEETLWFGELAAQLERDGVAQHKAIEMRSTAEIAAFFDSYVVPLVESLRRDGFDPGKTGYESAAVIDAQGRLSKAGSGNHRFAMATALDLEVFPLRIVAVHGNWYAREVLPNGDTWEALKAAFERVAEAHR